MKMIKGWWQFCLSIVLLTASTFVLAQPGQIGDRNQQLKITVDTEGCVKSVILDEPDTADNCRSNGGRGKCGTDKECVCVRNSKFITWTSEIPATEFKLLMDTGNPFQGSCKTNLSSKSQAGQQTLRCQISPHAALEEEVEYYYRVQLRSCHREPYDPRIVIGR